MDILSEAFLGLLLVGLGGALGYRLGRETSRLWIVGYVVPLLILVSLHLAVQWPAFGRTPPVRWFAYGSLRFALVACVIPILILTPGTRLAPSRKRTIAISFGLGAAFVCGVLPLLMPLLARRQLARVNTYIDDDGICIQRTAYTCGPAAAVTALRVLGVRADEGHMALWARSAPLRGTEPGDICAALKLAYVDTGVDCEFREFEAVSELSDVCPALTILRHAPMVDHWVVVLAVVGNRVTYGDPSGGVRYSSLKDFERRWRFTAITVTREYRN